METVEVLNATAGKGQTNVASLKRRRMVNEEASSPQKRRKAAAQETNGVQSQSKQPRLARKSKNTASSEVRKSLRGRDTFELPDEEEAAEEPRKPSTTTRKMTRKPKDQLAHSSLANASMMLPDTFLRLDESPAKSTRSKTKAFGPASSAQEAQSRPLGNAKPRGRPKKVATTTSDGRAGAIPSEAPAADQRKARRRAQVDDDHETVEPDRDNSSDETTPETNQRQANISKTRSVQRRKYERIPSTANDPDDDDKDSALLNFEDEANLYDCRDYWAKVLIGAVHNIEPIKMVRTTTCKKFTKLVEKTKKAFKNLGKIDDQAELDAAELELRDGILGIERQCDNLNRYKHPNDCNELYTDIYSQAIPRLVFLLKAIVKARYHDGALGSRSLGDIVELMTCTHDLCDRAFRWAKPRPRLENGVWGDTKNAIAIGLRAIRDSYELEKQQLEAPDELEKRRENRRFELERLERKIADERAFIEGRDAEIRRRRAEWNAEVLQREAEVRRPRVRPADGHHTIRIPTAEPAILDIDADFNFHTAELELSTTSQQHPHNHHCQHLSAKARGKLPNRRPPYPRAATTELRASPPTVSKWTDTQTLCLLVALEKYTGPTRFEDIAIEYGSDAGQPLADRDVDEIMAYAQHLRADYEAELKRDGMENSWPAEMGWLQSVPT